jgi:hypothetical protein
LQGFAAALSAVRPFIDSAVREKTVEFLRDFLGF